MPEYTGNKNVTGTPAEGTTLAGDVTGTTAAGTVAKLQGKALPVPSVTENLKVPQYVSATDSLTWTTPGAGGGGTSLADRAAFTEGTDSFTPVGGAFNDTLGADLTEDTSGVARITRRRALHINLRDNNAVEVGTASAPLRIDPTGATTQPVSGTVTANQGGTWTVQPGNTANTTAWKVDGSAVTQPVSGTVTANQGGTWTVQPGNTANTTAWKVDGSAVTQPVSAASLPLPSGAATDRTTAAGPLSAQLSDGAAFYVAAKTGQLPSALVGGRLDVNIGAAVSLSVGNFPADQLVHATNLDITVSALRDAITAAGAAAKTLADVVTAVNAVQTRVLAGADGTTATVRAISGFNALASQDVLVRRALEEVLVVLMQIRDASLSEPRRENN